MPLATQDRCESEPLKLQKLLFGTVRDLQAALSIPEHVRYDSQKMPD